MHDDASASMRPAALAGLAAIGALTFVVAYPWLPIGPGGGSAVREAAAAGRPFPLPPVALWASLSVLVAAVAAYAHALLGRGWAAAAAPVAVAVTLGWAVPEHSAWVALSPSPLGGYWNAVLQIAAVLIAVLVLFRRTQPGADRSMAALAVVWLTAIALVSRWNQLDAVRGERLWPDVEYVRALVAAMQHPYDTGSREPLWLWLEWLAEAALGRAPTVSRLVSLAASVIVVPATYAFASAYGRSRLLGVLAAGAVAGHTYLTFSAAQGHRTEWLVLEYLAVSYFAFVEPMSPRTRVAGLAISSAALVLTSLNGVVLLAGLLPWSVYRGRLRFRQALVVAALCAAALAPHVAYNYQRFGTYSYFTARAVPLFYRNLEFVIRRQIGCEGCPTPAEFAKDAYSGSPVSMAEYMFGMHTPAEVAGRIVGGFYQAFLKLGPDLAALLGGGRIRWVLFLAGLIIVAFGRMRELLLVPILSLNLSAFVVEVGLDVRLFTQPVGVAMLIMSLPAYYFLRWVGTMVDIADPRASVSTASEVVVGDVADIERELQRAARPGAVTVSVIVPVYNERHLVGASLSGVLATQDPAVSALQVVVVDDCSTDASLAVVERIGRQDPRVLVVRHVANRGKGAAVQTALGYCRGDVTIIHDADLEYDPRDIPAVVRPIVLEGADAVFGSRYLAAGYRRALRYKHSLMNRGLTALSNWFTDLDLTDVETCYKAVRTPLLKSIPLRSNDFRLEIELAMKLAKRRAHVFEVPIRYLPRTYREGKKIGARDGLLAVSALVHFSLVDDIYQQDAYGSQILNQLERTRRFNAWMGDTLRPFIGDRVLEIGAGIGTLTEQMIPRDAYTASDINPVYLAFLRSYVLGKPYLTVRHVDATRAEDFQGFERRFDTVMMINVLEHVPDEAATLANVMASLEPRGRFVVLVPQHPALYGTLDEALDHRERYTQDGLRRSLETAGFEVERIFDFNRASVPGWWLNGRVLKRRSFSRIQLKIFDTAVPLLRHVDHWLPYGGQSLIAIARRPESPARRPRADGASEP